MTRRVDYLVGGEDFRKMTAADFMERNVVFFLENSRGNKLVTAMTMGKFGSVPIADKDKKLVGVVSEFDLLKALRKVEDLDQIAAAEIMTHPAISVAEETNVEDIMKVLEERKLIRVPVIDKQGKLVGVVARRDILTGYLQSRGSAVPFWM